MGHLEAATITDMKQGLRAVSAKPLVRVAEARGFEPRMGVNPNRTSSPFAAAKTVASPPLVTQSAQVSLVAPHKAPEPVTAWHKLRCAISVPFLGLSQLMAGVAAHSRNQQSHGDGTGNLILRSSGSQVARAQ